MTLTTVADGAVLNGVVVDGVVLDVVEPVRAGVEEAGAGRAFGVVEQAATNTEPATTRAPTTSR
ncbi:MAG TPA: hypothetical protein VMV06_00175 [Acidimicrobiales bacterium]|nr:hypothetical protein [Acidimicrobiales bacterium]